MSTKHGYEGRPNYFCAVRGGEVTLFLCCKVACSAQATVETTVGKKNAAWKVRQGISQWLWFNYSLDMKMFGNWLMDLQLISLNKKKNHKNTHRKKGGKKVQTSLWGVLESTDVLLFTLGKLPLLPCTHLHRLELPELEMCHRLAPRGPAPSSGYSSLTGCPRNYSRQCNRARG